MPDTASADAAGEGALLTLLTWFSPGFPVGAFAYSHGLEAAIAEGWLEGADDVYDWIERLLAAGSAWNDLVLLAEGLRIADDPACLGELADLAEALAGSAERRAETMALGAAFARAVGPWVADGALHAYPLAVARAAAARDLPVRSVLTAYAHGTSASLVSAAVRLVPLGQSDAVALQRRLEPVIAAAAERASMATLDDLGSSALLADIAAMRHETLATRLFRS